MRYYNIKKIKKKDYLLFFRILFSIVAFSAIFYYIDVNSAIDNICSLNIRFLPAIVAIWLIKFLLLTTRWQLLLNPFDFDLKFISLLQTTIAGKFFDFLVPGDYGMDFLRYWDLSNYSKKKSQALLSVFMDRLIGFYSCVVIAAATFIPAAKYIHNKYVSDLLIIFYICTILIYILIVHTKLLSVFKKYLNKYSEFAAYTFVNKFSETILLYKNFRKDIIKAFILALVTNVLSIIVIFLFSRSLGWNLNIIHFFLFIPTIFIISTVPVSIKNLGFQEILYIYFFLQVNIEAKDALSLSLTILSWKIITNMLSGAFFVLAKRKYLPNN